LLVTEKLRLDYKHTELPKRNFGLGGAGVSGGPSGIHACPDTNSVTNIIGTVGKRSSTGGDDLYVRVKMFDLVGVLGSVTVDTLHATTLGGVVDTDLGGVDIVVRAVQKGDNDHGREALDGGDQVVCLVDGASAELVLI